MNVADWMSPDPVSISATATAAEAGGIMQTYGIRHLPVVAHGRVVGMLSDRDVHPGTVERTVSQIMSSPAHVASPEDTTESAARTMLSRHINALPVVDRDGRLVGIITTTDCLLASLTPVGA